MKITDVRLKTDDELNEQLIEIAKKQYNLRFQKASGQMENTAQVRTLRRTAAQIKTIQGERTRNAKVETKAAPSSKKKKAE